MAFQGFCSKPKTGDNPHFSPGHGMTSGILIQDRLVKAYRASSGQCSAVRLGGQAREFTNYDNT
jgi:hypothetical protein